MLHDAAFECLIIDTVEPLSPKGRTLNHGIGILLSLSSGGSHRLLHGGRQALPFPFGFLIEFSAELVQILRHGLFLSRKPLLDLLLHCND